MSQTVYVTIGGQYEEHEYLMNAAQSVPNIATTRTFSDRKMAQIYGISLVDEGGYDYYEIIEQEVE